MSNPAKQLIGTRVLVKPHVKETEVNGVFIPEAAREYTHRATVILVGPGKPDDPMMVNIGDEVLYSKDRVFPLEKDGEAYFILFQDSIHAVL